LAFSSVITISTHMIDAHGVKKSTGLFRETGNSLDVISHGCNHVKTI